MKTLEEYKIRELNGGYDLFNINELNIPLLLDGSAVYTKNGGHFICFFRNGYQNSCDWIIYDIEHEKLFNENEKLGITLIDFANLKSFCKINYLLLKEYADGNIDCDKLILSFSLNESFIMNEMANIKSEFSGLDRDLWIDNGQVAKNRSKHNEIRLKIQDPKGEQDSNKWTTIILGNELEFISKNSDISQREKNKIKNFIIKNYKTIVNASKGIIDEQMLKKMLYRLDINGNYIKPDKEFAYYKVGESEYGIQKVKSDDNLYNFEKDGKLISKIWFKKASDFFEIKNKILSSVIDETDEKYCIDKFGNRIDI